MGDSNESRYREIERPDFHSNIPTHLIDKLSDSEKYIIQSVSIIEQNQKFLINATLETNKSIREIDVRLEKIEGWKKIIVSKFGVVIGGIMLFIPLILDLVFKYIYHALGGK